MSDTSNTINQANGQDAPAPKKNLVAFLRSIQFKKTANTQRTVETEFAQLHQRTPKLEDDSREDCRWVPSAN